MAPQSLIDMGWVVCAVASVIFIGWMANPFIEARVLRLPWEPKPPFAVVDGMCLFGSFFFGACASLVVWVIGLSVFLTGVAASGERTARPSGLEWFIAVPPAMVVTTFLLLLAMIIFAPREK